MSKKICSKTMSFDDCELTILRMSIDKAQDKVARRAVASPAIKELTKIVEDFIKKRGLVPYGGIAINNILPKDDQFYDEETEIPDYDFFSPNAMDDAKRLADIYHKKGFKNVEAKAGQHFGTYKVFVQFIPVADITYLPKPLFNTLKKDAITVDGIPYTPPNFLRMSMFLELSRPAGDTSRWEKVYKRLRLLNKHYPLKGEKCGKSDFQRSMEFSEQESTKIFEITRDTLINQGVVFFGGFAISQYSQYMPKKLQKKLNPIPDFDVLSNDPKRTAQILCERLRDQKITDTNIISHNAVGEVIPKHYEVKVGKDTICFIYEPIGCHSYNVMRMGARDIKIATIDTMLSFYLAFLYGFPQYGDEYADRILCMSQFLFQVQQKNRLAQKGLLRRFSITCYGHQETKEEMRSHKAEMFEKLRPKKGTRIYEEHFLNYMPGTRRLSSAKNSARRTKRKGRQIKSRKKNNKSKKRRFTKKNKRRYRRGGDISGQPPPLIPPLPPSLVSQSAPPPPRRRRRLPVAASMQSGLDQLFNAGIYDLYITTAFDAITNTGNLETINEEGEFSNIMMSIQNRLQYIMQNGTFQQRNMITQFAGEESLDDTLSELESRDPDLAPRYQQFLTQIRHL